DNALHVLMTTEGHTSTTGICTACRNVDTPGQAEYTCKDCFSRQLVCATCCMHNHVEKPLNDIKRWNGKFFEDTSLQELGLQVQLGHPDGTSCPYLEAGPNNFTVIHTNKFHRVNVDFCGCPVSVGKSCWEQLMLNKWLPATMERPKTVCTFRALELFHMLSHRGKITAYDFYVSLEKCTDNIGGKGFKGRYLSFLSMVRQWRHLKELKRGGRGNDGVRKVANTRPGELAVKCIACPAPGVNLPEGWENAQPEDCFLYCIFIAIDACFRLKRRNAGTWETDPPLCNGGSYFVESGPYREYYAKMKDQAEICTCTGLAALDFANTKYSKGYTATGVAMCTCGRHEIIMPNGAGNMQKGERRVFFLQKSPRFNSVNRYGNIDYVWASAMQHVHILLWILLSYDIICQWFKHLSERIKLLPPQVRLLTVHRIIAFVIPKLHILGHLIKCQDFFN
ncbi:hypothetical protein BT96DRAFT_793053, partial [Gymnopus androsaceus JB14]